MDNSTNQQGVGRGAGSISIEDAVNQVLDTNPAEDTTEDSEQLESLTGTEEQEQDEETLEAEETDELEEIEESEDDEPETYVLEFNDKKLELTKEDLQGLLDLKELEVPFSDAKSNVMMQRAFTQKTQELAEQRKQLESQYETQLNEIAGTYEFAEAVLLGDLQKYKQTDWKKLKEEDPYAFEEAFVEYQAASEKYEKLQGSFQSALQEYNTKLKQQTQAQLEQEISALKDVLPEARSPETWKPVQDRIQSYLKDQGFPDGTLNGINDHKYIQILNDASMYRALKKSAPEVKKKAKKVQVLKPGTPKNAREQKTVTRRQLIDTAFQRGDMDSAIAAVADIIKR